MKCKRFIMGGLLAMCIAFAGVAGVAASEANNEAALARKAKISLNEAVDSAVKAVPGKVLCWFNRTLRNPQQKIAK